MFFICRWNLGSIIWLDHIRGKWETRKTQPVFTLSQTVVIWNTKLHYCLKRLVKIMHDNDEVKIMLIRYLDSKINSKNWVRWCCSLHWRKGTHLESFKPPFDPRSFAKLCQLAPSCRNWIESRNHLNINRYNRYNYTS